MIQVTAKRSHGLIMAFKVSYILYAAFSIVSAPSVPEPSADEILSACCIRDSEMFWEDPNSDQYKKSLDKDFAARTIQELICKNNNVPIDNMAECEATTNGNIRKLKVEYR